MRILVCEDQPDLRRALGRTLEHSGFAVDHAEDGNEALKYGLAEPYDAIVLDLGLPQIDEVGLRLRALIRRSAGQSSAVLTCGPINLYTSEGRVVDDGMPLDLTPQEFRIFAYLMHHPNRIISRQTLASHVYDRHSERESNVIDVLISRIRRKLSVNVIHTVRGQGYRLSPPRG